MTFFYIIIYVYNDYKLCIFLINTYLLVEYIDIFKK